MRASRDKAREQCAARNRASASGRNRLRAPSKARFAAGLGQRDLVCSGDVSGIGRSEKASPQTGPDPFLHVIFS